MISLTPLIAHLTAKPADFTELWFRQVAGAAEFAQVRPEALPLPACWVIRVSDKSDAADNEGRAEDMKLAFYAVIAIENIRTQRAGETDDVLLTYRHAVRKLLQGWEIEPEVTPIKFKGGHVLEYTDGDIYWRDRYEFDALITNYLPDPGPYSELVYTGAPAL
ncbi:phage tail terminator protein [Methylomonas sp. BW4-1]|uniref:phage tail terminator protein n=1 Tax=Methylomonas sp. BW4-1 TaxID=3376685 RepID=UPI004041A3AE